MEDKDASDYVLLSYDGDLVTRDSSMQMSSMIQEVEVKEIPPLFFVLLYPSPPFWVIYLLSRDESVGVIRSYSESSWVVAVQLCIAVLTVHCCAFDESSIRCLIRIWWLSTPVLMGDRGFWFVLVLESVIPWCWENLSWLVDKAVLMLSSFLSGW